MTDEKFIAIGRRKCSVARVYLTPNGDGFRINKKELNDYFPRKDHVIAVKAAFEATETLGKFSVYVNVKGGGITGQAQAIRHGISRALLKFDETLRTPLKKKKFLTRDSRMVERKKYGRKGARKGFQFSKR